MMMLHHYPLGTLSPERIKTFQAKIHAQYTPGSQLNYDPTTYAAKLANCADAIVLGFGTADFLGGVWGYCNDLTSRIAYISYIAKTKDAPQGLGFQMHEAFCWFAIGRGMERVRLEVLKSNLHAQGFYSRLGYVILEERENSYLLERLLTD